MPTNRALRIKRFEKNIGYGRPFYTGFGDRHPSKIDPEDFDYFPPDVKKRLKKVFFNIHNELGEISGIVEIFKDDELSKDHLAQGTINEKDGVLTPTKHNGHFALHEFTNVRLNHKFSIVCKLPE